MRTAALAKAQSKYYYLNQDIINAKRRDVFSKSYDDDAKIKRRLLYALYEGKYVAFRRIFAEQYR